MAPPSPSPFLPPFETMAAMAVALTMAPLFAACSRHLVVDTFPNDANGREGNILWREKGEIEGERDRWESETERNASRGNSGLSGTMYSLHEACSHRYHTEESCYSHDETMS